MRRSNKMPIAIKLFVSQLRSGAFNLMVAALVLASATATLIALTLSAIQATLDERASHLLAADVQIQGSKALEPLWLEKLDELSLQYSQAISFRAMVFSETHSQLFNVKAVDAKYPLKGEIKLDNDMKATDVAPPQPGEIYAPQQLLYALQLETQGQAQIDNTDLKIAATLVREPDNIRGNMGFAPTLLMSLSDVDATGVLQPGSRYSQTLYIVGTADKLASFKEWVTPQLGNHFEWRTPQQSNRAIDAVRERAQAFFQLGLALAIMLSGVAIGLSASKYALHQGKPVAILKTLGLGPRAIRKISFVTLNAIILTGLIPGALVGWLGYSVLKSQIIQVIPDLQSAELNSLWSTFLGLFLCVYGFTFVHFYRLSLISPLLAINNKYNVKVIGNKITLIIGFSCLSAYCVLLTGELRLVLYILLGLVICFLATYIVVWLSYQLFTKFAPQNPSWLVVGRSQIQQHRAYNSPQIAMLSILFTLVFVIVLARTSLLEQWRSEIPIDTPNVFAFNLFEQEKQALEDFLTQKNLGQKPIYPMLRARITQVEGEALEDRLKPENQINYTREMNITWSDILGSDNVISAGNFHSKKDTDSGEPLRASIEQQFAQGLDLELGDKITLSFQGSAYTAEVTSLRTVNWGSFNPNFFIILNRPPMAEARPNWLTSFYLPQPLKNDFYAWLRNYPTVTVADIDQSLVTAQEIIGNVSFAIETTGLLILISGFLVLIASLQLTLEIRTHEIVMFRVFGAAANFVRKTLLTEYAYLAGLACLIACLAAELSMNLLAVKVFKLGAAWHPWLWLVAPLVSIPTVIIICYQSTQKAINAQPASSLRALQD